MKCHVKKDLKRVLWWNQKKNLWCKPCEKRFIMRVLRKKICDADIKKKNNDFKTLFQFYLEIHLLFFELILVVSCFAFFRLEFPIEKIFYWMHREVNYTCWMRCEINYTCTLHWNSKKKKVNIFLKIFNNFNWNHFQWYHSHFLHFSHFSPWILAK